MRLLHRLRLQWSIGEPVVASVKIAAMLRPQGPDYHACFVQAIQPLPHCVERDTIRLMLILLPTGAEPEHEAAAGNNIDLGSHLRDDCRVSIRIAKNDRAHAHSRYQSRKGR